MTPELHFQSVVTFFIQPLLCVRGFGIQQKWDGVQSLQMCPLWFYSPYFRDVGSFQM